MYNKLLKQILFIIVMLLAASLACNMPGAAPRNEPPVYSQPEPLVFEEPASSEVPTAVPAPIITHVNFPGTSVSLGQVVYDVESSGTAPEKRAPYGDRYDTYRMERPFTQDMTYIPDMDIVTYTVLIEGNWVYVSIELIGSNPNNDAGIHYGVELDTDYDGFGEYIVWSNPPYTAEWSSDGVQVFADKNHDTGGLAAERSDAPLDGDGYETKIFDSGIGDDPDLAWVRMKAGERAMVQFAFKAALPGSSFLLGVLADANLRDVSKMYYNDRFTEAEAGSPESNEAYYPLKELYAFDNACREAFGFQPTGYEPLLCPREEPTPSPEIADPTEPTLEGEIMLVEQPTEEEPTGCQPPSGGCANGWWVGEPDCYCTPY